MSTVSTHKTPKRRTPAPAAWLVLGTMGLASVVFQVDHALGGGLPRWLIAGIVGFAPVAVSLGVAHMIALHRGGTGVRIAAMLVMACGMTLSIGAIGWVVAPYYHSNLKWLFGLLLDGAALFAAWVLLSEHQRKGAEESALAQAGLALAEAQSAARQAAEETTGLRAELARVSGDLTAAHATAEALRSTAPAAPRRPRKRTPVSGDTQDLTAELRAIQMLDAHPELRAKGMGSELGRKLGVSPATGRRLHASLTSDERALERVAQPAHEHSAQTAGEQAGERAQERDGMGG
jgi:hypothetical protein